MIANPLLVMKFGGNCLNTPENSAQAAGTVFSLSETLRPVVVVSAPGRAGSPYATDTLLGLADQEGLAGDAAEVDALIASGEIISAALFALRLQGLGLRARSLTGSQAGLITDGAWGCARITGVDPAPLIDLAREGIVPVVAGFQGAYQGRLATLGRGGSDLTAVALGAALKAPVTIFTDVDGVYTADPRLVADASRLAALSYEDAALLSYRGAKVLHPRASEMALAHQVDVTVARPDSPDTGTRIIDAEAADRINRDVSEPLLIGGVTSQDGRIAYALDLSARDPSELLDMTDRLFRRLAEARISLDMISVEESSIRFTVDDADGEMTGKVIGQLGLDATRSGPSSKVSIVGGGMHGRPGVMARVVSALYDRQILILQSSDSHNVISCLVPSQREHEAVEALHDAFFGPAAAEGQE